MLFFIMSSLITILSGSSSCHSLASSSGLGIGCTNFLPLLKAITAFTSSILGATSLILAPWWIPLRFYCVCEGNLLPDLLLIGEP